MNPVLGYAQCGCGKEMQVMQSTRRGDHLYSRCDDCGLDQRTGQRVQQWLWANTKWLNGPPEKPPVNIDPGKVPAGDKTGAVEEPEKGSKSSKNKGVEDHKPKLESGQNKPKDGQSRIGLWAALAVVGVGMGVAFWRL